MRCFISVEKIGYRSEQVAASALTRCVYDKKVVRENMNNLIK